LTKAKRSFFFKNLKRLATQFRGIEFFLSRSTDKKSRGRIFSHVRPFNERAVSDLDPWRYMHRPV
jgi:hypothetical protein